VTRIEGEEFQGRGKKKPPILGGGFSGKLNICLFRTGSGLSMDRRIFALDSLNGINSAKIR
jgi:hypothetical protein